MTPSPIVLCPACESGELRPGPLLALCSSCDYALSRDLFLALRQTTALPEADPARRRVTKHPRRDESGRWARAEGQTRRILGVRDQLNPRKSPSGDFGIV